MPYPTSLYSRIYSYNFCYEELIGKVCFCCSVSVILWICFAFICLFFWKIFLYCFFALLNWFAIWCSHKKKRAKQMKKLLLRGQLDRDKVDDFSLFLETGGLTYCLYKDSERILGNTFRMCILQVTFKSS